MNLFLIHLVICITGFITVSSMPMNIEEYLLNEIIKREMRSNIADVNVERQQQQQSETREEEFTHDLDGYHPELNRFRKRKLLPLEMYRRRSGMNEQVNKRNSPNNHNYYMQLCHFKICNMGKRRSRYWED